LTVNASMAEEQRHLSVKQVHIIKNKKLLPYQRYSKMLTALHDETTYKFVVPVLHVRITKIHSKMSLP